MVTPDVSPDGGDLDGRSIGKYRLVKELGSGATSTVYLARDAFRQRDVAIKVIHADRLESDEGSLFQRMFLAEATLVGRLRHPHVVEILDAGIDDNGCYIVMELIEGNTLETLCRPERLPPFDVAADIAYMCCKGLGFAHRHGLIHRDIKPANVLLSPEGIAKVTDFGAALNPRLAEITHVRGLGSVPYMSPQQVRGDDRLTFHTDIYSLGIVLFKMLTGRTPFSAESLPELVELISNGSVPAPSTFRAGVPAPLDAIVLRATAPGLGERYGTWDEFAADLAQFTARAARVAPALAETEKFAALRRLPLLAGFSDTELKTILPGVLWRQFRAGARILSEGDEGHSFFILIEGELSVRKGGRTIGRVAPGDWFGEVAYVTRGRVKRTAEVMCARSALVVEFNPDLVWMLLDGDARRIDALLLDRLARRIEELDGALSGSQEASGGARSRSAPR